jgi:hypothetical protein
VEFGVRHRAKDSEARRGADAGRHRRYHERPRGIGGAKTEWQKSRGEGR